MKTVRLLATNTLAQMIGKVVTVGSTILIGRMISSPDGIGKTGFDEYAIIVTYAAYFYIITDFGFNAIAAKEITEDETKTSNYISNLFSLRLALSICLIMLGLAILAFLPYSNAIKLGAMFMLVTIISQSIFTNGNILFQAKLRYVQSTLATLSGSLMSLALAFIAFSIGGNLFTYLAAIIIGSLTTAFISYIQVRATVPIRLKFEWQLWRYLIFATLPLGLTIVFNLLYVKSGFFILSIFDPDHYGIYTMAYRVFDAALVLPVFLVNSLYPIMVKRMQSGIDDFKKLFKRAVLGSIATSILVLIVVWVLAPIAIWASTSNPAFEESIMALRWLSLLIPLFFVSNILLWTLIVLEKRRLLVAYYGIGAVISIGLNLWLIPQYGYQSAIIITGFVEGLILLLMAVQIWSIFQGKEISAEKIEKDADQTETESIANQELASHE